ncbi:MAG: hypothetical protein ACRDTR_12510 [Rubrobacter sp.]
MKIRYTPKKLVVAAGLALSAIAASFLLPTFAGRAADNQTECESKARTIKGVTAPGAATTVTFNANPEHFDPTPLLSTKINVAGRKPSCLIAHFSAMAQPQDNAVVFQVRVDGVPMQGHAAGVLGIPIPVVYDPEETNLNLKRMVSYNFFAEVGPGEHTVEVLFAGCCSANQNASGAAVESPVLTLEYAGD